VCYIPVVVDRPGPVSAGSDLAVVSGPETAASGAQSADQPGSRSADQPVWVSGCPGSPVKSDQQQQSQKGKIMLLWTCCYDLH